MLRTLDRTFVSCLLAALPVTGAGDAPRVVPGERLEHVTQAALELAAAGTYTLARSDGALVVDGDRSEDGWLTAELAAGTHAIELPGGPGDVTVLEGSVPAASAEAFLNRGKAAMNAGDYGPAWTALLACRARPGAETVHGQARMFQGAVLVFERRPAEARDLLLGAREAVAATGQADVQAYLEDNLGRVALQLGDWDVAQQSFERLYELAPGDGDRALALCRLGQVAAGRGDHDAARSSMEEALAALTDGTEANYVSAVTLVAGRYFQARADFARAAELLERAAASAPTWHQQVASVGQLAVIEMLRGRFGAAIGLLDRVTALAAAHAPSQYDAAVLQNRAALAFELGEYGLARDLLQQLLAQATDGEARASVLGGLALLSWLQDDDLTAARLHEEALQAAPDASPARWYALNSKTAFLIARHRPQDADPVAQQALQLAGALGDGYKQAVSLIAASGVNTRLGRAETARRQAEDAAARLEAQDARNMLLPAWHCLARAALELGDEATVAALLERAWGESPRADTAALTFLEAAQWSARALTLSDWGAVAADLAARHAASGSGSLAADWRRTAQWKARALVADLQGRPDVPADLGQRLAAALGDRALVEYAAGDARLYAFVLEGGALRLVDLGERRPIEALVQNFVDGLRFEEHLAGAAEVARVGGELHARLVRPLGLKAGGVVIVPCGELSRLPFDALVAGAPKDARRFNQLEFLADRMEVSYAPSSAALAVLAQRPPPAEARGALLLGDPSYASELAPELLAARGSAAIVWERLSQTRGELATVATLLLEGRHDADDVGAREDLALVDRSRDVSFSTPAFDLRLGAPASVEALRTLAPRAGLIHIAAHAHVDRWDAHRTGLILSWTPAEQGLFSLADIAALKLDADLVVLSACSTAGGRLLDGEGVQSIAGAFLGAGARGVVATLWPVNDEEARDLMKAFARALIVDGETPERALRFAKRQLRGAGATRGEPVAGGRPDPRTGHPYYWAAYLFSGATAGGR